MNCADAENLICDYATLAVGRALRAGAPPGEMPGVRGTGAGRRRGAGVHGARGRSGAAAGAGDAHSVRRAVEQSSASGAGATPRWLADLLGGLLQPKFAMGMAMTILSLSIMARLVTPVRQLRPADLQPAEVWAGMEDRAVRTWARTVKFYENLKVVYQIQTMLQGVAAAGPGAPQLRPPMSTG